MALPKEIKEKLRECPLEIQVFVKELQSENVKLATQNSKLTAQQITNKNRITELKKRIASQAKEIDKISAKAATLRVVYDGHKTSP